MTNVKAQDVRQQLLHELDHLSEEQLNIRMEPHWTIGEVCDHLIKMDHQILLTLQYALTKNIEEVVPSKPIERALDRSMKIEAPDIVAPNPGPFEKASLIDRLHQGKQSLDEEIEATNQERLERLSAKHPVFSRLSLKQWVELRTYHEQRHIEQIKELKQDARFPSK
ncbi:DinB family protein [Alkalihalobacillus sp. LMS6]|uniref:DinB family protein n=1 Tax=Alkalihalobacillus sp. LMS6 TaxID=2924034 RepID=UPI0020D133A3|nr:DinB family protein [Alkalihalobacillus sp. LMS6]UTR06712.1 DinB family protein [Alkalihalobacillus sp. LMS6]